VEFGRLSFVYSTCSWVMINEYKCEIMQAKLNKRHWIALYSKLFKISTTKRIKGYVSIHVSIHFLYIVFG